MALYAAIGADFKSSILKEFDALLDERIRTVINQTLKQVAHDYSLDYKELKTRYCSKASLSEYDVPATVTVDLESTQVVEHEPEPEPVTKPKAKEKAPPTMALSKMKKAELVTECEVRGLDSEGTVAQLRERLKEARDESEPAPKKKEKPAPKKKEPAPKKKEPAPKKKEKPAPKKKEAPPPPPPVEELEEERDDDEYDICPRVEEEEEEDDYEFGDDDGDMKNRLRKILADAGELVEEDDEDEDDE